MLMLKQAKAYLKHSSDSPSWLQDHTLYNNSRIAFPRIVDLCIFHVNHHQGETPECALEGRKA